MKTPFISVRSFGELWEIGASVPGLSIALGKHREVEVSPEVSLRLQLSWLWVESTLCQLSTARLALPAQFPSSAAIPLWPSPPSSGPPHQTVPCQQPCSHPCTAPLKSSEAPAVTVLGIGNTLPEKAFLCLFHSICNDPDLR